MDSRNLGQQAEQRACVFLEKNGLTILARNYQWMGGEIDLIMQDKEDVVFVEVRLRQHAEFGSGLESVTPTKQRKLINTALHYLQKQGWLDSVPCRFDVISLSQGQQINWIKNAFFSDNF